MQKQIFRLLALSSVLTLGTTPALQGESGDTGSNLSFDTQIAAYPDSPEIQAIDSYEESLIDASVIRLQEVRNDKCLDVEGNSMNNAANVKVAGCHTGNNQRWWVNQISLDTFELRALHSGLCLTVKNASTDPHANVQQENCHGGTNQQWRVWRTVPYLVLQNVFSGNQCLDVAIHHQRDNVQQYPCHGNDNQEWRIFRLSGATCDNDPVCDPGESYPCLGCPAPPPCNFNGLCELNESPLTCADCVTPCNYNGICERGESSPSCSDCFISCNNNRICEPGEDPNSCSDCNPCPLCSPI